MLRSTVRLALWFSPLFAATQFSIAQEVQSASMFSDLLHTPGVLYSGRAIHQTSDGGYILVGGVTTTSPTIVMSILVVKLESSGDIAWQNQYTVSGQPSEGFFIRQTPTGYILAATMGPPAGSQVILVLSIDPSGQLLWQRTYPTGGISGAL